MASFAAIFLPYRRRDLFEQAPEGPSSGRSLGIPVMTLLGIGNPILFSLILYSSFDTPAFSGPTGNRAIAFVVGIYVSGVILYYTRARCSSAAASTSTSFYKEIPPE